MQVSLGWLFFYAGITKILNPEWTSKGYLENAQTFSGFYKFLASPSILPFTDFLNEWGLALIGIAILTGIMVRWAGYAGALLMLLYYFPVLNFPHVGEHSYIVDDHIIYAIAFLMVVAFQKGSGYSLKWLINKD